MVRLAAEIDRMILVGGLRPQGAGDEARYPIPPEISFVPLPYYESLAHPASLLGIRSFTRFWRTLAEVDTVWLFGPHPMAILFALLAAARRRRVVLGARQDTVAYMRSRHPGRRGLHAAARVLEALFKALARWFPIVVVGPELAERYGGAPRLLEIVVSLVDESDIVPPEAASERDYSTELRVLSVGRLDVEKNPLLLADALAWLNRDGERWRLVVCGEGDLEEALAQRLAALGEDDRAELLGYVSFGEELVTLYRTSHVLLHTSWTEGLPQTLLEAMAAGLPVVAADVGGIRAAVGEAAVLVPPGDPAAAGEALRAVATDPSLRDRLVQAGHEYVRGHTRQAECSRVAEFLADGR